MKQFLLFVILVGSAILGKAQKIDSIFFHLYTDSLKKGTHNYINVDGKTSDGKWKPLTGKDIDFTSTYGKFEGNELILPDECTVEKLTVKAILKTNPALWKEVTIWIKKKPDPEILPTKEEILGNKPQKNSRSKGQVQVFNTKVYILITDRRPLSLRRQVLHDQLLLNLPRAGRQQG